VTFGFNFDQPVIIPKSVRSVQFHKHFNQEIEFPNGIQVGWVCFSPFLRTYLMLIAQ
jgi:hypothetical protein